MTTYHVRHRFGFVASDEDVDRVATDIRRQTIGQWEAAAFLIRTVEGDSSMMVRFATLCDICQTRSPEYQAWPSCENCLYDICPACMAPGTLDTGDGDRGDRCYCTVCHALLQEEY